jgi:serine/threonine-protein kinase
VNASTIQRGTVLAGRYRVGERLGRGGMADVYAGTDVRLERPIAIKVLRPEVAAQHDVRARFEAEARTAARLAHPNAVAVYDTGDEGGLAFIVMERLPGETLADRIRSGPVDLEWLRRVAGDVLGALGAAHAAGMVHRDVKPGNILLAADGRAKVADFGIAKSVDGTGPDLTATNTLLGTPAYLSPEQVGGAPATARSDLYALGVVLYEAATGRKPFTGDTPIAMAYAIDHADVDPLAQVRPDVDGGLSATVERAMDRDPARRFGSATEMAAALGLAPAADETVPSLVAADADATMVDATPVTAMTAMTAAAPAGWADHARRRRLAVMAAVLLGVVLAVALVRAADDSGGPEPARTETGDTEQRVPETTPRRTTTQPPTTLAVTTTTGFQIHLQLPDGVGDGDQRGNGDGGKKERGDDDD